MTSRAWVHQDVANLRELEAAATRALQEAGCLGGWEIREARRIADAAVAVTIAAGPAEADAAVVFEWAEHGGEDLPAFRRGARHVASYRSGRDGSDPTADPALRDRVTGICQALADADEIDLRLRVAEEPEVPPADLPRGLAAAREAAEDLLGSMLPDGWTVQRLRRLDARSVVIELGPETGPGLALDWIEPGGEAVRAFAVGPLYAAATRRDAGSWDPDGPETPGPVRDLALAACGVLAHAAPTVSLRDSDPSAEVGRPVRVDAAEIGRWLEDGLGAGGELVPGWALTRVSGAGPSAVTLALAHGDAPATLTLAMSGRGLVVEAPGEDVPAGLVASVEHAVMRLSRGVRFVESGAGDGSSGLDRRVPTANLNLAITGSCNAMCRFCMVLDLLNKPEYSLTDEQIRGSLEKAAAQGCKQVDYTGGEPTVHPRLLEFIAYAGELGFTRQSLSTNAIRLKDPKRCEALLQAGLTAFDVSIHGHTDSLHDDLVRRQGALRAIRKTAANLRELRKRYAFDVCSTTVITSENMPHLPEIADFLTDLGVDNQRFKHNVLGFLQYETIVDLAPPYDDVVPKAVAAIDRVVARSGGIEITHIPLCMLGDHAVFCRDFECSDVSTFVWDADAGFMADSHSIYRHRMTPEPCGTCVLADQCARLDRDYERFHGLPALRPFESVAEVEAIFARALARFPGYERLVQEMAGAFRRAREPGLSRERLERAPLGGASRREYTDPYSGDVYEIGGS